MDTFRPKSVAILGAGVTGLVAAHRLTALGHRVRVFEQSSRAGGAVRTERIDGWLIEAGPNSLLSGDPATSKLIGELGLQSRVVTANSAKKHRFVVRGGRLIPAPLSPSAFLSSPLFSISAKVRVLSEALQRPRTRTGDVSLSKLLGGHFGSEFVDYLVDPFVSGVYAGDPAKLSSKYAFPKLWQLERSHGSLLRGQIAEAKNRRASGLPSPAVISFALGLQTLTDALVERLPTGCIAYEAVLQAIAPGKNWNVIWQQNGDTHSQAFEHIVLALPAYALGQLRIGSLGERPLAALDGIEHPPLSSLYLGFKKGEVQHPLDGFGVLAPSVAKRIMLGVLFSSSLFPARAPEDHVALTVMVGGARHPELAVLSVEQLLTRVLPDLSELLGIRGDPVFVRHTFWPRAIPQYTIGYDRYLTTIAAVESAHPRLHIGGQARDGISLPACIGAGERLAMEVSGS
jgi:oxygen-dependent protoporphyrinogen oxidase